MSHWGYFADITMTMVTTANTDRQYLWVPNDHVTKSHIWVTTDIIMIMVTLAVQHEHMYRFP